MNLLAQDQNLFKENNQFMNYKSQKYSQTYM